MQETSEQYSIFKEINSNLAFIGFTKYFKNKYVKWISLILSEIFKGILLILFFIFIFYILIVTNTLINFTYSYKFLLPILLIFICSLLVIHFIISLYVLHIFINMNNKGEQINISAVLPNFIISYLEYLKLFSESLEVVKAIKNSYYRQIVLYTIILIWAISNIFYI